MPESTSSNTIVGTASRPSAATSIASEMRESSPPDATLRKGRAGCPRLAATRNSTRSPPCGSGRSVSSGSSATSKRPPPMPSSAISAEVSLESAAAASRRFAPSASAPLRPCIGDVPIELLQAFVGATQALELLGDRITLRSQLLRRHAMLARKFMDAPEAAFELRERIRVDIEVAAYAIEQGEGFVDL